LKEKNEKTKQLIKERDAKKQMDAMQKLAQLEKKRERYKQWSALNTVKTDLVPNQKKPPISAKHKKRNQVQK
jgi:hypothetical protein